MRVIFFGTPAFAVPTLERLLSDPHFKVLGVVTQPDKRRGRGGKAIPSAVKTIALRENLPVWQPERIKKDSLTLQELEQMQADVFVVVAYGQILSLKILNMPRLGCVNVHGSILPQYRGAAPIQWCLYHGERETGITTMLMDKGMDTGDMLLKSVTPIRLRDNAHTLAERLAQMGADLLIDTLLTLDQQQITPIAQDNDLATYAPLISKPDYELDWQRSALELHNQVRAFFPSCIAQFRDRLLKVMETSPLMMDQGLELPEELTALEQNLQHMDLDDTQVGEVVFLAKGFGPVVKTGQGLLVLHQVQLAGKRAQLGSDFMNGSRLQVGDIMNHSSK
ncbi:MULTISPECIES: methionyl-tRNA formyltransferase [unclassified Roseofilum]|uniref:methionyl-tRNA formyltransferase n=1 Tax=unclassified Roseofilum TaxID=2620099 RepID=UPI000E94689B|nr:MULTISPECIES: methionyl-tRNA formyltransferase [unclassified Roseofilum]MBP0009453.1 methionyl-tRNA formyltransferase [Roseofilum sp. Belize Diploria]MBP0033920.1 methionyl-tRNA formyltransferase [Roseofilum sp. Belize BBD 4]HBQ97128.1 methionyl-tRNA formyltransferase [Cyanobacteria bacterium UBA11691]